MYEERDCEAEKATFSWNLILGPQVDSLDTVLSLSFTLRIYFLNQQYTHF